VVDLNRLLEPNPSLLITGSRTAIHILTNDKKKTCTVYVYILDPHFVPRSCIFYFIRTEYFVICCLVCERQIIYS
jgi:hypothetical protein